METIFFDSAIFSLGRSEAWALAPYLWLCFGLFLSTLSAGFKLSNNAHRVLAVFVFAPFAILLAEQIGDPTQILFGTALETNAVTRVVGCGIGILAVLTSIFVSSPRSKLFHPEWLAILIVHVLGLSLLPGARDFIAFFVSLETLAITGYILAAFDTDRERSLEAGIKYLLTGAFGSAVFLMGIAFFYGAVGSFDFEQIRTSFAQTTSSSDKAMLLAGGLLVLTSLCFKIALFPLHMWAPDVYQAAPTAQAGFLATASKISVTMALAGLWGYLGFGSVAELGDLLFLFGSLSIVCGSFLALAQRSLRRLFAYSGVVNSGYAALAIASGAQSAGSVFTFLLIYSATLIGIFALIEKFSSDLGVEPHGDIKIEDLRGVSNKTSPFLVGIFAFFVFSVAGIPPLPGFFGKYLILKDLWLAGQFLSVATVALGTLMGLAFYLKILVPLYMSPEESIVQGTGNRFEAVRSRATVFAAVLCLIVSVVALSGLTRLPRWVETVEIFAR